MSDEVWLDVPGHEGKYRVSNLGRVLSLPRQVRCESGMKGHRGGMLAITVNAYGYHTVGLSTDGVQKPVGVHRLVCLAFNGPPPTPKHQVCHNNGIRTDNRPENLRWGTCKENHADRLRHGTAPRGERAGNAKLSDAQAAAIRVRAETERFDDLAAEYGVSSWTIRRIKNGKRHIAA